MNRILLPLLLLFPFNSYSQGWPENYQGVMLQGFYWDSYSATRWTNLERQSDELSEYFDLIWIPQSGYCDSRDNMGYMPVYYFRQESSFGTEAELRSLISTLSAKGTGVIADVVVNHRGNVSNWVDFPKETYKGNTYQMFSTDICKDDDGGAALKWATSNGYSLSENNDTGTGWDGGRDLDHKSANVQKSVKAYLDFLLNDLGYIGFRYDMVKGYSPEFTAIYNTQAKPTYSVGECWDNSVVIKNWVNGTKVDGTPTSAAFDFQFRYSIRDAIKESEWSKLSPAEKGTSAKPLASDNDYKRWAVTFVENHDTERRANSEQDPIKSDTLAANAYMLAMPGTPCVFLKHWNKCKGDLKRMIKARKLAGIHSQSSYRQLASENAYYALQTSGATGTLICVVGLTPEVYTAPAGYTKITEGKGYIYYLSNNLTQQWAEIERQIEEEQAQSSDFTPYQITVFSRDDLSWSRMNYYIWDSNDNTQLNGNWPGKQITDTQVVRGKTWYKQIIDVNSDDYYVNLVFSTGTGGNPQTVDVTKVSQDKFFVITQNKDGAKYLVEEDTSTAAFYHADVSGDDVVNISDVVAVINHIAGIENCAKADVDGDGSVNITDVVAVINYIANN